MRHSSNEMEAAHILPAKELQSAQFHHCSGLRSISTRHPSPPTRCQTFGHKHTC